MTLEEEKINNMERTLDRVVLLQEQTTKNIDTLTHDIKDFGCPKSACSALDSRITKIETIITKLNWLVLTPVVIAVVYLVVRKG